MKKILSLIIAAAMLAICLASCGGKSVGVKVIDIDLTAEEYAYGVDKAQPELLEKVNAFIDKIMSDGTFEKICNNYFGDGTPNPVTSAALDNSKDQLVVATNAGFEPFEYMDGDKYVGIDMEIADLLAKELGLELVINNMDFDAVCLSVGEHKCDIAMAGLTVKPDREEYVAFSKSPSTPARLRKTSRLYSPDLPIPPRSAFRAVLPVSSTYRATRTGASPDSL